jgi:N-acetylglucosamine kinase-like BadF-type ATPase
MQKAFSSTDTPWQLIADSGSTKTTWCVVSRDASTELHTQGISPYFLTRDQILDILETEVAPKLGVPATSIREVHYYGTGLGAPANRQMLTEVLETTFPAAGVFAGDDLLGAARALCGRDKGVACILGTGSNSCFYDGSQIVANNPGLGFILGDEGSGAVLGRKVIQYYLYHTFDEELSGAFDRKYQTTKSEILDKVYRKPFPNRYLASFSHFLNAYRGHFMIENILEDGLNDFFFTHVVKYPGCWEYPVHFTGGVAWAFRDVIASLCDSYELQLGHILKAPIEGLVAYHRAGSAPEGGKI